MQIVSQAISAGRRYVQKNPEKVQRMTRQAGEFVNKRTGGKYRSSVAKAESAADRYIAKQTRTSRWR